MIFRARRHCTTLGIALRAAFCLALAGCQAATGGPGQPCPLPGQMPTTDLKLYFGRTIPGGGFVDDAAWRRFAEQVLTPAFPEGFTVWVGRGQWRNPNNGQIGREESFVLERVGQVDAAKVEQVMAAYRTQFRQVSVGRMTEAVCGAY